MTYEGVRVCGTTKLCRMEKVSRACHTETSGSLKTSRAHICVQTRWAISVSSIIKGKVIVTKDFAQLISDNVHHHYFKFFSLSLKDVHTRDCYNLSYYFENNSYKKKKSQDSLYPQILILNF